MPSMCHGHFLSPNMVDTAAGQMFLLCSEQKGQGANIVAGTSDDDPGGERQGMETIDLVGRFLSAWEGASDEARARALKILSLSARTQGLSEPFAGYDPEHCETSPQSAPAEDRPSAPSSRRDQ